MSELFTRYSSILQESLLAQRQGKIQQEDTLLAQLDAIWLLMKPAERTLTDVLNQKHCESERVVFLSPFQKMPTIVLSSSNTDTLQAGLVVKTPTKTFVSNGAPSPTSSRISWTAQFPGAVRIFAHEHLNNNQLSFALA